MSNQNRYSVDDNLPDNIYYNVRINNTDHDGRSSLATYDVSKDQPVLRKCCDYYLSIIDYSLNLNNIPLFICQVQYNSGNPTDSNYTIYDISVTTAGGVQFNVNLTYIPDNNFTVPAPPISGSRKFTSDPYYYIYSYTVFITMINNALTQAYINAGSPGAGGAPYFQFIESEGLIALIVPDSFVSSGATVEINSKLQQFLGGFEYYYLGNLIRFRFVFYQTGNICNENGAEIGITGGTYWIYKQQYYNLQLWNSLRKILMVTNSIPINNEFRSDNIDGTDIPNPIVTTAPVLFDYAPKFNINNTSRTISYYSSCQNRLIDLINDNPLYRINVTLLWQDCFGFRHPLSIGVNDEITIKIAFIKKSIYKNYFPRLANI